MGVERIKPNAHVHARREEQKHDFYRSGSTHNPKLEQHSPYTFERANTSDDAYLVLQSRSSRSL